jgi:hypothetical protein
VLAHGEHDVRRLLTPAVREYLLKLHAAGVDVTLADDHAEIRRGVYFPADEADALIEGDPRAAAALARFVDQGRAA